MSPTTEPWRADARGQGRHPDSDAYGKVPTSWWTGLAKLAAALCLSWRARQTMSCATARSSAGEPLHMGPRRTPRRPGVATAPSCAGGASRAATHSAPSRAKQDEPRREMRLRRRHQPSAARGGWSRHRPRRPVHPRAGGRHGRGRLGCTSPGARAQDRLLPGVGADRPHTRRRQGSAGVHARCR